MIESKALDHVGLTIGYRIMYVTLIVWVWVNFATFL